MKSTNHNKISGKLLSVFNEEKTFELPKRLKDLHLLRPLAINRIELSSDYFHLQYIVKI